LQEKKGISSFLKKRTKKPLLVLLWGIGRIVDANQDNWQESFL